VNYKSKYLVIDTAAGLILPFVFSELLSHDEMAAKFKGEVIGAGFCYIQDNLYVCYGESISCKVKSRGEVDSRILNKLLGAVYE
jgi:hypothetical protein